MVIMFLDIIGRQGDGERAPGRMIGCGAVTEKKSGPGLYKSRHSSLRALYSRDHGRAKDWALRHGVPVAYETAEALFADPEIDAVYISTPPRYHKEYALRCLEAGKIAYIEKPHGEQL